MRDRFLRTLVFLGAAVWFITELLSGFDAIRRAPMIVSWILAVAAAAAILGKGGSKGPETGLGKPKFDFFAAVCCAGCAAILILNRRYRRFQPAK